VSFTSETSAVFKEMFADFCADVATSDGSIVFEKLDSNRAPTPVVTLTRDQFELDDHDPFGRRLPEDVLFELRAHEDDLTNADLLYNCSLKHVTDERTIRYIVMRPTGWFPQRFNRLWRFWLMAAEQVVSIGGIGTVLRFSETTYAAASTDVAIQVGA
jgi:hypothetical protein